MEVDSIRELKRPADPKATTGIPTMNFTMNFTNCGVEESVSWLVWTQIRELTRKASWASDASSTSMKSRYSIARLPRPHTCSFGHIHTLKNIHNSRPPVNRCCRRKKFKRELNTQSCEKMYLLVKNIYCYAMRTIMTTEGIKSAIHPGSRSEGVRTSTHIILYSHKMIILSYLIFAYLG